MFIEQNNCAGKDSNNGGICENVERMYSENVQRRRHERFLQKFGSSLDEANSVHHDEIRLLRENDRNPLQVRSFEKGARSLVSIFITLNIFLFQTGTLSLNLEISVQRASS